MRRLGVIIASASALAASVAITGGAQATPFAAPEAMRAAAGHVDPIENVQVFVWSGRRYCWYDDGWHGPGWYWCGFAWRRGSGWGGGSGWHGWRRGGGGAVRGRGGERRGVEGRGGERRGMGGRGGERRGMVGRGG